MPFTNVSGMGASDVNGYAVNTSNTCNAGWTIQGTTCQPPIIQYNCASCGFPVSMGSSHTCLASFMQHLIALMTELLTEIKSQRIGMKVDV